MNELAVQGIRYKLFFGDVAVAVLVDRCSGRIKILFRSRVMIMVVVGLVSKGHDHQT